MKSLSTDPTKEDEGCTHADEEPRGTPTCASSAFERAVEKHRLTKAAAESKASSSGDAGGTDAARHYEAAPPPKRRKSKQQVRIPEGYGKVPDWLAASPTIGRVTLHASHSLGYHRGLVWCWKCGHYGGTVPIKLKGNCEGLTLSGEKNLSRLRKSNPPSKTSWPLDEAT